MGDLLLEEEGKKRRQALDRAKADGELEVASRLFQQEMDDVGASFLLSDMQGVDPFTSVNPRARHVSPEAYEPFALAKALQREQDAQKVFDDHPGIQDALKGLKLYGEQWNTVNKAPLAAISPYASVLEQRLGRSDLKQQEIPEAVTQAWITQTWDYISKQKAVNTKYDPKSDPRINKMVSTLNSMGRRQAGGEFFEGRPENEDERGIVNKFFNQIALSAGDVMGVGEKIGEGVFTLGLAMLEGTDSEFYKAYQKEITPKFYIDTDTGKIAQVDGRVGGLAGPYINLQLLMGKNVEEIRGMADQVKGAVNWSDTRKREGLEKYSDVLARALGGLTGMGATGGFRAIQMGNKGAALLLRAVPGSKLGVLAQVLGTGVGYGTYNMGMVGDVQGYGHAFLDAMVEAPLFVVAGSLGARVEKLLARKKMPKVAKRSLAGMTEGMVFTAAEMGGLESSLWNFMRNPEDRKAKEDWLESIVANVMGFGIFKSITGMSPGKWAALAEGVGQVGIQGVAQRAQVQTARKKAAQRMSPMDVTTVASEQAVKPETIKAYADALKAKEAAPPGSESQKDWARKVEEIERDLERQSQGVDRTKLEAIEEGLPTVREISEARDLPSGPEKTQRILELQRRSRGEFAKKAAETLRVEEEGKTARGPAPVTVQVGREMGISAMAVDPKAMKIVEKARAGAKLTRTEIETVARELAAQLPKAEVGDLAGEKPLTDKQLGQILSHPDVEAMVTAPAQFGPGVPKSLQLEPGMAPEPGAKPVQLGQIQARMEGTKHDPVFTKMRGGLPGKAAGIVGWFENHPELIRLPKVDGKKLVIMAHEWSHAMEKAAMNQGVWEGTRVPGWMMSEFAKVAATYPKYDKLRHRSKVAEGWAEFWAREMLGDPSLKGEVPQLHQWMMDWLIRPENKGFKKQHDEVADMIHDWTGMGEVMRGKAELGLVGRKTPLPLKVEKGVRKHWLDFTRAMTDDLAVVKSFEKALYEHRGVDKESKGLTERPVDLIDLYRMSQGSIAEEFLKQGSVSLSGKKTGEALEDVFRELVPKEQRENFMVYMNAVSSLDMMNVGLPVRASKQAYLYRIDQLRTPEFDQAATRVREWSGRLLDYMQEGGVISAADKAFMQQANPFAFMFKERIESGDLKDPMQAIHEVTRSAITRTQQSMVARSLWLNTHLFEGYGPLANVKSFGKPPRMADHLKKLMAGDPNAFYAFFMNPISKDGTAPTMTLRPMFTEMELRRRGLQGDQLRKAMEQVGRSVTLEIADPTLGQAMNSLSGVRASWMENAPPLVSGFLRGTALTVRAGATITDLMFAARNLVRDAAESPLHTRAGNKKMLILSGYADWIGGMNKMMKGGDLMQMFAGTGGKGTSFLATEWATVPRKGAIRSGLKWWAEKLGEGELALRREEFAGVYEILKAEGKTDLDAALGAQLAAKNNLINFTRRGALAGQLAPITPYFTAAIAAQRRHWRAITGLEGRAKQVQTVLHGMANIGGLSALLWWLNHDEEWYQQLPEWKRVNYWTFKLPGMDQPISLPKPWEAGRLFGTGTEIFLEAASGEFDKDIMEEVILTMVQDTTLNFPFGWLPAGVRPTIEVMTNYNSFFKKELVPGWMERVDLPERQFLVYTSETAKIIGKALKMSPAKIEHWFGAHTGGMGLDILRTVEGLVKSRGDLTKMSEFIPGKSFLPTPFRGARDVQKIFDLSDELGKLQRAGQITSGQKRFRKVISDARRRLTKVAKDVREGRLTREQGDLEKYKIAAPVIERYEQRLER